VAKLTGNGRYVYGYQRCNRSGVYSRCADSDDFLSAKGDEQWGYGKYVHLHDNGLSSVICRKHYTFSTGDQL
jgi:hypothetical protein